jgi:hypothetical protein
MTATKIATKAPSLRAQTLPAPLQRALKFLPSLMVLRAREQEKNMKVFNQIQKVWGHGIKRCGPNGGGDFHRNGSNFFRPICGLRECGVVPVPSGWTRGGLAAPFGYR